MGDVKPLPPPPPPSKMLEEKVENDYPRCVWEPAPVLVKLPLFTAKALSQQQHVGSEGSVWSLQEAREQTHNAAQCDIDDHQDDLGGPRQERSASRKRLHFQGTSRGRFAGTRANCCTEERPFSIGAGPGSEVCEGDSRSSRSNDQGRPTKRCGEDHAGMESQEQGRSPIIFACQAQYLVGH